VLATRQALIGVEHQVLFGAVQAYMRHPSAEDIVALRQGNVRVILRELEAAQDRFELGEITRTDVAIAEARLAASRGQLFARPKATCWSRAKPMCLRSGASPGGCRPAARTGQLRAALDEAKASPASAALRHRAAPARTCRGRTECPARRRRMGPRLTARATRYRASTTRLLTTQSALTLSQRLYQGGGFVGAVSPGAGPARCARSRLHQVVAEVEQGVGEAWAQRSVARAASRRRDRQIRAARTAYDGVREEANSGRAHHAGPRHEGQPFEQMHVLFVLQAARHAAAAALARRAQILGPRSSASSSFSQSSTSLVEGFFFSPGVSRSS
jgi:outer membrane protein